MLINKNLERLLLVRDTTLTQRDVSTILKRTQVIVEQDNIGGHKVILGSGLVGDVPINEAPNSITLIVTLVTDTVVYCYSELSPQYASVGGGNVDAYTKTESNNRFYPLTLNPAGYATESWVNSKGYLTSASFANYWTKAQSDARYLNQSGGTGTNDYNALINKPFIPSKTSDITNDSGYITGYSEVDTLDSVLARGNTSNKNMNVSGSVNLSGSLQIPSTPSNLPNSIWLSTANSTGHTGGGSGASALSELLDVQLSSPLNGQALLFNGAKWVNSTIITDLSNYYTKGQSDTLFQLKGNYLTSVDYSIITSKPFIPTNTNQLTNGAGFITGYSETDTLNSILSRGNTSAIDMNLSGKLSVTGELVIPSTPSNSLNAIWIGNANSTGSTGGGSGVSYLSSLLDTQITSPLNGQSLVYNGSKWVNTTAFAGDYNALSNKPVFGDLAFANNAAIDLEYITNRGNTTTHNITANYLLGTYINMSAPSVDATVITDIVTTQGDGYLRRNSATAVKNWLAFTGNQINTGTGNAAFDIGVSQFFRWKNYGNNHVIIDASQGTGYNGRVISQHNSDVAWSPSYPMLVGDNGTNTYGLRVDTARVSDITNESWDSMLTRNPNAYRNITLNNGASFEQVNDAAPYFKAVQNQRSDVYHKYIARLSDNVPVMWKENWWDGSKYHSWTMDSEGFVANSKLTTVSSGNGATTYQGSLEVRGTNAGITFHYPGYYAAPLWMGSGGVLNWSGAAINSSVLTAGNYVYGANYVQGGRVIAGYDSGVAGSVNANGWFRSLDATGWFNASYGGGIWMNDSNWVKTYGGKGFLVDNEINGIRVVTNDGFKSTTFKGLAGDYDTNGTSDKIIWTIGDSWNSISTHYGLGYSYSNSLINSQHQIVGRDAGTTKFSLSLTTGGAVFTGRVHAESLKVANVLIIPTTPSNEVGAIWIA